MKKIIITAMLALLVTSGLASVYGVTGIPHTILFAPDGTILSRRIASCKELDKKLETIFGE